MAEKIFLVSQKLIVIVDILFLFASDVFVVWKDRKFPLTCFDISGYSVFLFLSHAQAHQGFSEK